ncbi:MAG: zf-HC2 domain-containing protein [Polyangiaceae bacterium]|nr:zf-HC2 domain-containing protein [Polyangiaceae bacterium]
MTQCLAAASYLEAFVDGELPPEKLAEIETHLARCPTCSARVSFERAVRVSTQRAVRTADVPSAAFRDRIARMIEAERERARSRAAVGSAADSSVADTVRGDTSGIMPWRTILTLAAAAALVIWGGWRSVAGSQWAAQAPVQASSSQANISTSTDTLDQLIDEFVDYHSQPRAPQITEPSQVTTLEPEVGLPVRLLPTLQDYGARWQGGGVVWVKRDSSAASLQYSLNGHRITVYVYNSARFPLRARLEPRVVRNVPVFVGTRRGYSIAATERGGVGYALATDLGDAESAELVATTALH